MTVDVHHGDSRVVLQGFADSSIDSVVTDPPYALVSIGRRFGADNAAPAKEGATGAYARASAGFMGKKWDTGATAFDPEFWREVLRVLKPGGHLVAFGGTRTYHRLTCAIEDAGFEIRDMTAWLYGSGFPKSHDVSKAIDKAAGAKRRVLSEGAPVKRMIPGADQNKAGWEKDNGRTFTPAATEAATEAAKAFAGWGTALKPALEPIVLARKPLVGTVAANVLAHGTGGLNIDACRIGVADGDIRSGGFGLGNRPFVSGDIGGNTIDVGSELGRWPANVLHDGSPEVIEAFPSASGAQGAVTGNEPSPPTGGIYGFSNRGTSEPRGDAGSAARFFFSAKADGEDRLGSKHPTVKPVDLMAWLCRLITPPGGLVLDPFAGSGTTALGAMAGGFSAVLIEREDEYVADIHRRLAWARGEGRTLAEEKARRRERKPMNDGLFAGLEPE